MTNLVLAVAHAPSPVELVVFVVFSICFSIVLIVFYTQITISIKLTILNKKNFGDAYFSVYLCIVNV